MPKGHPKPPPALPHPGFTSPHHRHGYGLVMSTKRVVLGSSGSLEQSMTQPQLWRDCPMLSMKDNRDKATHFPVAPQERTQSCPHMAVLLLLPCHIHRDVSSTVHPTCCVPRGTFIPSPSSHCVHRGTFIPPPPSCCIHWASPSHHLHRATSTGPRTPRTMGQKVFAWPCITVWCFRGRDHVDRPR